MQSYFCTICIGYYKKRYGGVSNHVAVFIQFKNKIFALLKINQGILFATILTVIFTICKVLNYQEFAFWDIFSFLAEATVILSGVIILLNGEFFQEHSEVKDERYYSEKYA